MNIRPAIYVGSLRHRRFAPVQHDFTYPIFMACLDIDRIEEMMSISPFASHNRWNWASFFDEDHFGNPTVTIRRRLLESARARQMAFPDGKILLLTHLRYLGYNFNPVSFFYCHNSGGALETIVAEVNNTFGETHNYWLRSAGNSNGNSYQYHFPKEFHVSPFFGLDQQYEWTFASSGDSLIVQTNSYENGARVFDATLELEPREWNRKNLHDVLLKFPWMTLKVISEIHWQAARLWGKGVPVVHHPGAGRFDRSNVQHLGASWNPGVGDGIGAGCPCATSIKIEKAESQ